MWGEMARLTAITPKVFVSNTSLITSSEVTSCAPNKPIAALFTTASIFPNRSIPFAIALEMLLRLRDVEGRDQQLIPVVEPASWRLRSSRGRGSVLRSGHKV